MSAAWPSPPAPPAPCVQIARRHVREALARQGYELLTLATMVLRSEMNAPVQGWVFSAAKAAAA